MRIQHHMRIDVRGVLRNWNPREWRGCVSTRDGRVLSTTEVHEGFLDALAAGKKYVPLGEPCEGWTSDQGCPGHPLPDEERDSARGGALAALSSDAKGGAE